MIAIKQLVEKYSATTSQLDLGMQGQLEKLAQRVALLTTWPFSKESGC